jgi:glycerol-3-phosphate dehydrogenase
MGQETIDKAVMVADLPERDSITETLPIHGAENIPIMPEALRHYGSDKDHIRSLIAGNPELGIQLHPALNFVAAEVVWVTRVEMAQTVEDVLARRVRALFLDARASIEMAPQVARLMAAELGYDENWVLNQIEEYKALAQKYILSA